MNDTITELIARITDAPMPWVPGAGPGLYRDIERIRCDGATRMCADVIRQCRRHYGEEVAESCRRELEPVRLALLSIYPAGAGLLDARTWPDTRSH